MKNSVKPSKTVSVSTPTSVASKPPGKVMPKSPPTSMTGAPAKKRPSFWDDDDEDGGEDDLDENQLHAQVALDNEVKLTDSYRRAFQIESPNGARILIIDQLGKDWKDLLCYNYELKATLHLKREDLRPAEAVNDTIAILQKLVK